MNETSIPRIDPPAARALQDEFITPGRPVILRGGAEGWPALERWSAGYLKGKVPEILLPVVEADSHHHPDLRSSFGSRRAQLSFAEYVDLVWSGDEAACRRLVIGDSTPLLDDGAPSPAFGALLDDVIIPPCFERDALRVVGFWLSAMGVRSWLHYDRNGLHNLNAQVKGQKSVWMYAPTDAARLYPFLYTGEAPRFTQYSRVDVEAPDLERFPAFQGATRFAGILEEGDVLFIPAFWFHSFKHLGRVNINVNFWWRPERQVLHGISARSRLFAALSRVLAESGAQGAGLPAALSGLSPETRDLLHQVELRLLDLPGAADPREAPPEIAKGG